MLQRLAAYLHRHWGFESILRDVADERKKAQIPASNIFLSVFLLFAARLGSLNHLEQHLRMPGRWKSFKRPSADTIGYCLERFNLEILRDYLAWIAHRAKRMKALKKSSRLTGEKDYWIAALDGHELWCSQKRCCSECKVRTKRTVEGEVQEYYHQVVVLQIVNASPPLILDFEPILVGEGEVAAATRMLKRIRKRYPRFFKVLTLDALYLQAPFVQEALRQDFEMIAVFKQEQRTLFQDALYRMNTHRPVELNDGSRKLHLWDLPGLDSWPQIGRNIRVVRSAEEVRKRERSSGTWVERTVESDWMWATTLSTSVPAATIVRWGRARWDIENRCFNELHCHWAMDHCFHHHPKASMAFLIILAIAFALTYLFFQRNLKPLLRTKYTRIFLADLFRIDLAESDVFLPRAP